MINDSSNYFVADVGGTNIRLASVNNNKLVEIKKYLCTEFEHIEDAINKFKQDLGVQKFDAGCIAIACPVNKDTVKMTNHSWTFSKSALKSSLSLRDLFVINDFTAVAFSLPVLGDDQLVQIGRGKALEHGNIAVFGPGTGLGVEHLTWTSTGWQTLDGEGGHVDFAPNDEDDLIIWKYLQAAHGRASAEEVLSGRGIVNIYRAFCASEKMPVEYDTAAQISEAALKDEDSPSARALQQFSRILGSFAGNLALNLCTTGGVFIGGGIVGKLGDLFNAEEFRKYFENKGAFAHYLTDIPTFIINEPDHGLVGASAYLSQQLQSKTI